jgi:hypothetical protein
MNTTTKIEMLVSEQRDLINSIDNSDNIKETMFKIKAIDTRISKERKIALLNSVNQKQARLRELALQAWEAEQPLQDITTNDGSFHAVKVRKYPKLAALKYVSAKFEDGKLITLRIDGEKFNMYSAHYDYAKPTEYTRPATFDEFLKLNTIMPKDMTLEEFETIIEANEKINNTLKAAIETASAEQKKLNMYSLSYWGLFNQKSEHVHPFEPNRY